MNEWQTLPLYQCVSPAILGYGGSDKVTHTLPFYNPEGHDCNIRPGWKWPSVTNTLLVRWSYLPYQTRVEGEWQTLPLYQWVSPAILGYGGSDKVTNTLPYYNPEVLACNIRPGWKGPSVTNTLLVIGSYLPYYTMVEVGVSDKHSTTQWVSPAR